MAYVFKRVPSVIRDVPIDVPGLALDAKRPEIKVKYRLRPISEQRQIFEDQRLGKSDDDELMKQDILDFPGGLTWQDVDDDGEPQGKPYQREFSPELLAELMEIPFFRVALVQGWLQVQANAGEARAKN